MTQHRRAPLPPNPGLAPLRVPPPGLSGPHSTAGPRPQLPGPKDGPRPPLIRIKDSRPAKMQPRRRRKASFFSQDERGVARFLPRTEASVGSHAGSQPCLPLTFPGRDPLERHPARPLAGERGAAEPTLEDRGRARSSGNSKSGRAPALEAGSACEPMGEEALLPAPCRLVLSWLCFSVVPFSTSSSPSRMKGSGEENTRRLRSSPKTLPRGREGRRQERRAPGKRRETVEARGSRMRTRSTALGRFG